MNRLSGAQWRYCAKVGIAAALGYALTQGGHNQYAIYSAFTAALVVGTSVGEDLATSANRVKGTLAGMIAGTAVAALVGPSILSIGLSAAFTAILALGLGWGVPVARIGVTLCIVSLAAHSVDVLEYDLYRALNTLIGIVAGLGVTFFVWPVRSAAELERALRGVASASRALLDAIGHEGQNLTPLAGKLHDRIAAAVKAIRDAFRERRAGYPSEIEQARVLEVLRLGIDVLSAALGKASPEAVQALRQRLDELRGQDPFPGKGS